MRYIVEKNIKQADNFLNNGNHEAAYNMYKDLLKKYPKNVRIQEGFKKIHDAYLSNNLIDPPDDIINSFRTLFSQNKFDEIINFGLNYSLKYPQSLFILNILGLSYANLNDFENSITNFKKALDLSSVNIQSLNNYGNILSKKGDFFGAIRHFKKAIQINPNYYQGYNNLGNVYLKQSNYVNSLECYQKSLQIKTNQAETNSCIGVVYEKLDKLSKAEVYFKKALKIDFKNVNALINYAGLLHKLGNIRESKTYYEKALKIDKTNSTVRYNLSLINLYQGKFDYFNLFSERWKLDSFKKKHFYKNITDHDFKNFPDKTILVWEEQGIGDLILFSRFLNNLKKEPLKIYCQFDKKVFNLFSRSFPKVQFLEIQNKAEFDFKMPIGDLAQKYLKSANHLKNINTKYLNSNKSKTNKIKKQIEKKFGKHKIIVGLSWLSYNKDIGKNKSISLEHLKKILLIENFIFLDLQYSNTIEERKEFEKNNGIKIHKIDYIDNLNDLDGLGSLISACDFIISTSNTNAHLSGALGKTTYLILPKGKGKLWYWTSEKNTSLWYNSIKIFEQESFGDWSKPIENIYKKITNNLA